MPTQEDFDAMARLVTRWQRKYERSRERIAYLEGVIVSGYPFTWEKILAGGPTDLRCALRRRDDPRKRLDTFCCEVHQFAAWMI